MGDFKPKIIMVDGLPNLDEAEMIKGNTFAFISTTGISPENMVAFDGILDELKINALTLNYNNDGRDEVGESVFKRFKLFSDIYLPFKNFNKEALKDDDGDEITPTLEIPTMKAHRLAALLKYKNPRDDMGSLRYNGLNETVKLFSARDVHMLTGAKCAHKVKFLIVNTADDAENATEIDFKTTGSAAFPIIIASKLDIPVFNIHKRDRIKELGEFINNL